MRWSLLLPASAAGFLAVFPLSRRPSTSSISKRILVPPQQIAVDPQLITDLGIAGVFGTFTDPAVELIFNTTHIKQSDLNQVEFKDTLLFGMADSVSTAARVLGILLLSDVLLDLLHLTLPIIDADLSEIAPTIALAIWCSLSVSAVKRTLFLQAIAGTRLGRVAIYDKLIDFLIGLVTTAVVLDVTKIDVGMGLQSVLAGSGVGALVFSLASKDLAQQIVGGFVIQAWDAFEVGDDVRLGDSTEGTVKKIGLVETEIVGWDNVPVRIPNSQLTSQRVSNLSLIKRSRVFQSLRFKYSDLDKLPRVLDDIKDQIRQSCPELIVDGSKPFQAILTAYEADHISAVVNCHFEIPLASGKFAENRQQVLLAIARALEKNSVSFALPSIEYQSKSPLPVATQDD